MMISSRRFDQVFMTLISGLLIVGSGLLIWWGPPPNPRGARSAAPPSVEGTLTPVDFDVAADALVPVNSPSGDLNNSGDWQSASIVEEPMPSLATTRVVSSSATRKPIDSQSAPATIRHVPIDDSEIERAWKQAAANSCEFIPPNEPFEITRPTPFLTPNDRRQAVRRLPIPGIRQHVLSVGLQMSRQGEQSLPALGRHSILDYINRHYVTVQARVQHDPVSGLVYLHHRPLAATMQFSGSRLTQEFTDTVGKSMHEFRGLGIWLLPDEELMAENLRTLVLVHRYVTSQIGTTQTNSKSVCELMFVRAHPKQENFTRGNRTRAGKSRESTGEIAGELNLHTFVTTNERQSLHYISPDTNVRSTQQCGIKALIEFTAYSHGAYPTESVVVGTPVRSSATYGKESLDNFARQKGWKGSCFDHLSQLLDAIINRELPAD